MTGMKKYFGVIIFILFVSSCGTKQLVGANGVEYGSAREYNNYIIDRQKNIIADIKLFGKALNGYSLQIFY